MSGGVSTYLYHWSNNTATEDLTNIYAGVYSVTVTDVNICTTVAVDTINSLPPPTGWEVTPTTVSHEIFVPQNASITLDALALSPGSYIGVFYLDATTQSLVCGGWAYWSGMETSVIAYGTDPGMNNGFDPGAMFTWRVYDAGLNVEYGGSATYSTSYPNSGNFVVNGVSGIEALPAFSIISHTVSVPAGWSIWSTYVDPIAPNIADILAPITAPTFTAGPVEIVKNGMGNIFWPYYGINNIGNIVIGEGYQMKINNNPASFDVVGFLIAPELNTLTYNAGWSIIGYLRTSPANIEVLFTPIVSCIEIVKNDIGQIYWPTWNINFIGNMLPGEGYQLKMNCTLPYTFPPNISAVSKASVMFNSPQNYDDAENTGNNMTLGILNTAWNVKPDRGDEIGVFDASDNLIGSAVYDDDFSAITLWGSEIIDDSKAVKDGAYTLKLWHFVTGVEDIIVVEEWMIGNDQFETNSISIIEKLVVSDISADQFALYQNMPNPFKESTDISFNLPEACNVTLTVYNTLGKKVEEIASGWYTSGKHTVEFNSAGLPSGNYFYKIITDEFVATKSMNLNR